MAKSIQTLDSRFSKAPSIVKARLIGLSAGEVGSGKSSFWLSAPGPIVVFSLDQGLEGVVEEFQQDKEIFVQEYEWLPTEETSQEEAIQLRDQFTEDFEFALTRARTIVIDKETQLWELFRYAEFGAPNDAPRNYPALNQRYRRLLNMPKGSDANFGIIQSMKDRWVTKNKSDGTGTKGFNTGERVPQGFGEADEIVHMTLMHQRINGEFSYTVGKSRGPGSREVQDQTFTVLDPKTAFTELAMMVYPETSEDDWQ